jgi:EPS-associated MarR family transcriptional regulator
VTRHGGSVPKANLAIRQLKKEPLKTMTSRQAKIQEDTHFRIMRILQDNPDLTQRELADKLGMSVGGLNYCLNALIDKGFVKMANFSKSKNKFKYVYLLTPQGIAEKVALTSRFLKRKMEEYDALKVEIEALKAEVGEDQADGLRKQAQ